MEKEFDRSTLHKTIRNVLKTLKSELDKQITYHIWGPEDKQVIDVLGVCSNKVTNQYEYLIGFIVDKDIGEFNEDEFERLMKRKERLKFLYEIQTNEEEIRLIDYDSKKEFVWQQKKKKK